MSLLAHAIGFFHPVSQFPVEIGELGEPEDMQMIARRKSLHLAKPRMIEPASEDQMSVEPPLSRRHLRKRHPNLEGNPRLFRDNPDWTNRANEGDHRVEEFSNLRAFPRK